MTKHSFKKIMPLSVLVILLFTPPDYLISENLNYTISKPEVFKRNKASCSRLGNVYDACQWMTKVIVKNRGRNDISKLCLLMKVNKKKYELCYGQKKELFIKKNGQKTFLINLTELMNISIDAERPYVKILSKI
tara:strand:+ start:113 stop:514 length:402 start_codon:yes stop_codon:yes gene_type:complete